MRRSPATAAGPPPSPPPPSAAAAADPSLVWTHLYGPNNIGSINFQYYLPESMRQARIFNPTAPFFLLCDNPSRLHAERPSLARTLAAPHLNVSIIDVSQLRDWQLIHIETRMRDVWGPLAHEIGTRMEPSLGGGTNTAFTVVTLTRLLYLHHWMRATTANAIIHVENDQMVYGGGGELATPAKRCALELCMGRVAQGRAAAAVMYVESHAALAPFLDFLWEALSHGWQHAADAVGGNLWVTDMSLLAAYVGASLAAGRVAYWPVGLGALGGAEGGGRGPSAWLKK